MRHQAQSLPVGTGKVVRSGKRELLFIRNGKHFYKTDQAGIIIQDFNSPPPDNGKKSAHLKAVGVLRNEISSYLFDYLDGFHIPTHFVGKLSNTEMLVREMDVIPLSVVVYNAGHGYLSKRLGFRQEPRLDFPVIEHFYTGQGTDGAWVNEYHIYGLGIATPDEYRQINRIAAKVNAVLRGLGDRRQLSVNRLQLEFGRYNGHVYLADELSPRTCQFLDMANGKEQRERFIAEGDDAASAMGELRDRLKLKA